ncbi:MAG: ABC-F family ATP-binding cassette domain-containing protein [Pseudomonadota bacterium]
MARAPLLQLNDLSLTYGGNPLFAGVSLVVQSGERIALVGRNGSGKSTLMKVIAGLVEPDTGERVVRPGTQVGYLEQDPDMVGFATLGDYATSGLPPSEHYRVERAAEGLQFSFDTDINSASGGERRRAALAQMLAGEPELMLLDEPTNHLDITAIEWLEAHLKSTSSSYVLISHDRRFLNELTAATLWLDRGTIRHQGKGFAAFESWRDKIWADEDIARHKLDRKIAAEARWAVEGISARRKRNQGRVRALQELRAERASQIKRQNTAAMELSSGTRSGRKVIEAQGVSKAFDSDPVVRDFDLILQRQDRVAFVGPNGAGKTTLLNLLLKTLEPDAGQVKHGTNLIPAVFDQTRAQLNPDETLWEALTGDEAMRLSGRSDQVMVRGTPRHVVAYLKDFLFDERQARAPIRSLSGGEKARLLLAKLMARESNLLVLDEPTNDLDIETLDLLQELLDDYDGTVLLVSHDRDFIDRVATRTVVMEGQGRTTIHAGGWSEFSNHREAPKKAAASTKQPARTKESKSTGKLTFKDKHRFETLPAEIERIEAEIAKLEDLLADAALYTRDPEKFTKATEMLAERQAKLSASEEEWLTLAERVG